MPDEAKLERMDPDDFRDTMDALGPDDAMRIFGRGLRRRLAPMLGGDGPRLRLAFSLLFAMPGAPLICYGDEIGMGKDLSQKGRNGGFSTAQGAIGPGPGDGRFRSRRRQCRRPWADDGSLLNLVARLAAIRLAHPGIGRRECRPIGDAPDSVIALRYAAADHDLVVIHNLSAKPAPLDLDLGASCRGEGSALLGDPLSTDDGHLKVTLPAYDFRWSKWPR